MKELSQNTLATVHGGLDSSKVFEKMIANPISGIYNKMCGDFFNEKTEKLSKGQKLLLSGGLFCLVIYIKGYFEPPSDK